MIKFEVNTKNFDPTGPTFSLELLRLITYKSWEKNISLFPWQPRSPGQETSAINYWLVARICFFFSLTVTSTIAVETDEREIHV